MIESAGSRWADWRREIRNFLSQDDLSSAEIQSVLDCAIALRSEPISDRLKGRSMVMFFEKASTRTRLSFEIGMTQLGGHAVYLDRESSQLSRGESLRDTAQVVSRYADIMMARVFNHQTLTDLAQYASIPIINGLSDYEHPVQSMGDLLTIRNHKGRLEGLKVAYIGDGNNNVTHSLMVACAQMAANVSIASPAELAPDKSVVARARSHAEASGSTVLVTDDPVEAATGADVIYTDVWISMGREAEREERLRHLRRYQVNEELAAHAKSEYIFMHCLPQHIGDEVTEPVAYSPNSVIFDQAENRLHIQKALILFLLGETDATG